MNFLVLSLTCVFCKSAVCHRNLRMLAAAVSGTGLEAFGLMVLPYAISVLCTAIGIVPLMVFLAFGRENKKQRTVRILSASIASLFSFSKSYAISYASINTITFPEFIYLNSTTTSLPSATFSNKPRTILVAFASAASKRPYSEEFACFFALLSASLTTSSRSS